MLNSYEIHEKMSMNKLKTRLESGSLVTLSTVEEHKNTSHVDFMIVLLLQKSQVYVEINQCLF